MKIGSLFSGIGGIELGFEKAGGFETIWFVEKEPYAQAVLRKHWPGTPIYEDITKIDFKKLPKIDILTGGFPCQDISNAGKRVGINGEKSGLWKEYLRAISEIRPKYAFVENVSALCNRGLETVLCDLASVGYDAEWHCLPASAIGAPHRRDRIYIIAMENSNRNRTNERNRKKNNSRKESKEYSNNFISTSSRTRIKENLAHSNKQMLHRGQSKKYFEGKSKKKIGRGSNSISYPYNFNYWQQRKKSLREKNRKETWATDTGILRVANGIPNRIHRIKCVGNAVVPQVAEFFAEVINTKRG